MAKNRKSKEITEQFRINIVKVQKPQNFLDYPYNAMM